MFLVKYFFLDYCKIYQAKRQILIEDRNIYIEVPLHYSCRTGLNSTLKVLLECNTKESKEKHGDIGTCTFAVLPKIKETCEEKVSNSWMWKKIHCKMYLIL